MLENTEDALPILFKLIPVAPIHQPQTSRISLAKVTSLIYTLYGQYHLILRMFGSRFDAAVVYKYLSQTIDLAAHLQTQQAFPHTTSFLRPR